MDWLDEELGGYDDDYLIIDCPGTPVSVSRTSGRTYSEIQVRLNSTHITHSSLHLSATSKDSACERVQYISLNPSSWRTSTNSSGALNVYTTESAVLIGRIMCVNSGVLSAMSAMVNLEVPWINIMSKMDLVTTNVEDKGSGRNGIRTKKDISRSVSLPDQSLLVDRAHPTGCLGRRVN